MGREWHMGSAARKFMFADEAGNFDFTDGKDASKYFIVCTITTGSCDIGSGLLELRRELLWEELPLNDYFHATEDKQDVRDRVFQFLEDKEFTVQATILEKRKARPQLRNSDETFYRHGWFYHMRHTTAPHIHQVSE